MVARKPRKGAPAAASRSPSPKPSQNSSQQQERAAAENENPESYATKFKHLLEPIRDLAENWNVDIARDLEIYLADLEILEISLDGGATTLNFAEAALLIQGTTCVYSRKVEYLHKLVFHVLEVLSDSQAQNNDGQKAADDGDNDDPEKAFPREPEFIALDDIAEAKSTQIDLADDKDDVSFGDEQRGGSSFNHSPQLLLMSLEADPDSTDPNKDLRLHSAVMHSSGALLLESRFQHLLDRNLQPLLPGARTPLLSPKSVRSATSSVEAMRAEGSPAAQPEGLGEGPGSPLRMILEFEPENSGGMDDDGGAADSDGGDDFDGGAEEGGGGGREEEQEEEVDLWAMLDPHDASGSKEVPFRRGRTHRQPRGGGGGAEGKGAQRGGHLGGSDQVWAHQRRSLKLPYFADMGQAFLAERNRVLSARMAQARAEGKAGGGPRKHAKGWGSGGGSGGGVVAFNGVDMEDDYDEIDVVDGGGGCGDEGAGAEESDDDMGAVPEGEVVDVDGGGWGQFGGGARGGEVEWGTAGTYEEMCQARIAECMRGVESYLQESGLEARVREWRNRLEPRLEEEAARPVFDIHVYGAEVSRRLSAAAPSTAPGSSTGVPFSAAVAGMSRPDVCRAFLAALQLANDGNLDIHLEDPSDRSSVRLELLDCVDSTHAALGTYVAPSVLSAQKKKQQRSQKSPAPKRSRNARPSPKPSPQPEMGAENEAGPEEATGTPMARLRAASPLRPLNYAAAEEEAGAEELEVTTTQCSQSLTQPMGEAPAQAEVTKGKAGKGKGKARELRAQGGRRERGAFQVVGNR